MGRESQPHGAAGQESISPETVRAGMEKLLNSDGFVRSERLTRFVRFTVEQTLAGKGGDLKEFVLAVEVFDKDSSFDPRVDTSVRVEARRLRSALQTYYATTGKDDPVRIEYRKGSYAPVFCAQDAAVSAPPVDGDDGVPDPPRKGIRRIVYGLAILTAAALVYWVLGRGAVSTANPITSIAVLPFADMSPEQDQEYFCDGLSEELIHGLTKVDGLHVVARTSAFQFKGKAPDIRFIGQQLKVGAILEGSVRKEGRRLKITAQFNKTEDGFHLWSETYERDLNDVFAVQEDIARAITKTLKISLAGRTAPIVDRGSDNSEAHNLYLQGRYFWNQFTAKTIQKSIPYFEQAIEKDPRYARAYVGLADAYGVLGYMGAIQHAEGAAKRTTYLAKAFELNPNLPEAFISRGMAKANYDFDWAGAEKDFRHGLELNPKDPEAHFRFATPLSYWGRLKEAREELTIAQKYDPLSQRINAQFPWILYLERKYQKSIDETEKMPDLDSPFFRVNEHLGMAYVMLKNYGQAIPHLKKALQLSNSGADLGLLGYAYGAVGRRKEAEELLARLDQRPGQHRIHSAQVYIGLGDYERALDLLEQAYKEREGGVVWLKANPRYDPLRNHPRFQKLLRFMNLQ